MFLSVKVVKGNEYAYVVENRRVEGRVVQTIVRYLGRMEPEEQRALREMLLRTGLTKPKPSRTHANPSRPDGRPPG